MGTEDEMTPEEKRHDQLTTAPDATEDDARPRIVVSDHDGAKRIDIADDSPVRPGDPTKEPDDE
ncbi:multidrug transporter [Microbacterium marinilacus]|uniref:Pterin-binding domain-containing protein n=1 Tax=Microbacterium marinilacus TaxID=415209 RepID=A0ABP7B0H3_9MICO|nr:multidrug transporter [Microbacterium marinilacus]MBY0688774.1 multidrug transporter [Microbacterium marinilacus]